MALLGVGGWRRGRLDLQGRTSPRILPVPAGSNGAQPPYIDAVVAGLRARGTERVGEVQNYEDIYRLCCARGPEGIIVELAERIG